MIFVPYLEGKLNWDGWTNVAGCWLVGWSKDYRRLEMISTARRLSWWRQTKQFGLHAVHAPGSGTFVTVAPNSIIGSTGRTGRL